MRRIAYLFGMGMVLAFTYLIISTASASASPLVQGLAICNPGPSCHYGPVHASYPNYKSVCSFEDCNFIAAADLIEVTTGLKPSLPSLETDYRRAGQSFNGGLSMPALFSYWKSSGMDGNYLVSKTTYRVDRQDVELGVRQFGALIVRVGIAKGSLVGTEHPLTGTALIVVDGYTPKGPLVVFQGRTIQMTWSQWRAQVEAMWEVVTTEVPPSFTTTTTMPPLPSTTTTTTVPTTLAPTGTLQLSESGVPSSGASVILTFTSQSATNCSLSSVPSLWSAGFTTVSCNGTYQINVVPASEQQHWVFTFTATNSANQSVGAEQTLTQNAPAPPAANSSSNWAGYVVPSSSSLITDSEGTWTVPTLNCSITPNGDSAVWVGIGGEQWSTGGSSGTLLQTGTDSNCVNGAQENDGWFEVYPSTPNRSETFENFPVTTGDVINSQVYETTTDQWVTLLSDLNTGLSGIMLTGNGWGIGPTSTVLSTGWSDQGSTIGLSYSGGYTAEWIVEDYSNATTNQLYPFADFGSVTFSNLLSSFTTWTLTHSETWAIVQNGVTLATPTTAATDGFTVSYAGLL